MHKEKGPEALQEKNTETEKRSANPQGKSSPFAGERFKREVSTEATANRHSRDSVLNGDPF